MDRLDYFFRQKVTEAELDDGFAKAEAADWNLVVDSDLVGIHFGLAVTQQGVPNMTVLVTAGAAYDSSGRRIRVPSNQNVNCAVDFNSVSTAVAGSGNERWLAIFAGFTRALSDPRTDGNALTVQFQRAESFEFRVVSGVEAAVGLAARPALDSSRILIADVRLTFGQTSVVNASISTTRRQDTFAATTSPVTIQVGRAKEAFTSLVSQLAAHMNSSTAHAGANVTYAGGGTWADGTTNPATTVEAQLDKVITDLALTTGGGGAARVGIAAVAGTRIAISAGTLAAAITALQAYVNSGPLGIDVVTLTGNTTITTQRQIYLDSSGGVFNLTLPAPSAGRQIFIKDKVGALATANVTLVRSGSESIEGLAANRALGAAWGSYRVHSDGTNWFID